MTNTMSKLIVVGAFCAKVGPSRSVVRMVPFSVRARASGLVRVPSKSGFTTAWVPAEVVKAQELRREHLAHYGAVEADLKAMFKAQGINLRASWGDIMFPPAPADDLVCVPLPAGRVLYDEFRAWVAEGWKRATTETDKRRYVRHIAQVRRNYFAQLPDSEFARVSKHEPDAAALAKYREANAPFYVESEAVREKRRLRRELAAKHTRVSRGEYDALRAQEDRVIREMEALRAQEMLAFQRRVAKKERAEERQVLERLWWDIRREPFKYVGSHAEMVAELKTIGQRIKSLREIDTPTEVVLDGSLWPERVGGWVAVLTTGRVAVPVKVEITAEAKAEEERVARWKAMQAKEMKAPMAARNAWHHKKAVAQTRGEEREETVDTGFNYWREQNY